jgi:hypothetical protein
VNVNEAFLDREAVEDYDSADGHAVFEGDTGKLTLPQRLCLVALLKHHYISAAKQPSQWATLLADGEIIASRLNDLFLDLRVDRELEVAFKVQVRAQEGGWFPPLLKETRYSREETLLLIFLRGRYTSDRQAGHDHVYVDREELIEHVAAHRPARATDVIGDNRKAENAVNNLADARILLGTSNVKDDRRFMVAPIIETLLTLAQLQALTEWLAQANSPEEAARDGEDGER